MYEAAGSPSAMLPGVTIPNMSLIFAWIWILAGFLSGMILGFWFHQERWLGGYASHRRRLYRLGHISFFGLGIVNLAFYVTARLAPLAGATVGWAAGAFIAGGILMPICCLIMAHWPQARMIFAAPIVCLTAGAGLVILEVL
jgi:hypothetical protein